MNPTGEEIYNAITTNKLELVLKGDIFKFVTPSSINDDMQPTDHDELLVQALYPLAKKYGSVQICTALEKALEAISIDALGVFCSVQCFYLQIVREDFQESGFTIDRKNLPIVIARNFLKGASGLHALEVRSGDLDLDRAYRVTLSRMIILARDHGIEWGVALPKL